MKVVHITPLAICTALAASLSTIAAELNEPTWESLSKHAIPEWLKDAKFGVYTSVPDLLRLFPPTRHA